MLPSPNVDAKRDSLLPVAGTVVGLDGSGVGLGTVRVENPRNPRAGGIAGVSSPRTAVI
jgi:hypothetical protein